MLIDYIIIILAVVCFTAQFAFTKIFEGSIKQTTATTISMLVVTSLVGALIFFAVGGFRVDFTVFSFAWAFALAVVMIPYYMIGIKILSYGSLAIYSMFMMLGGMLVPFFYGVLFLHEPMSWGKAAGSLLLTACIVLQALSSKEADESKSNKKQKTVFFLLCIVIFFINGATGVIAKAHQIGEDPVNEMSFTVMSCLLTAIMSALMLAISCIARRKDEIVNELAPAFSVKPFLAMIAIGAAAYTGSFLHLRAASNVPATVQFPLVSGGVIVLSALVSALIFKEKLSKKEWISVAGAFVSTFLFAF